MPELPEVETVRIGLEKLVLGKRVASYEVLRDKSFPNDRTSADKFYVGAEITDVRRRGKALLIDLDNNYSVMVHLKMTGQLVFRSADDSFGAGHPNDSLINDLPDNTTRVITVFDDESRLFFNDQRVFGWMKLLPTAEIPEDSFIKKLGPEPLEKEFTFEIFKAQVQRRKKSRIKAVLLDQTVVAGVGNIYADESLWAARIHPETRVDEIPDEQLELLHKELVLVLKKAIEFGGSTDKNYRNADGQKGSYMGFAKVFRREGQDCPRCGTEIQKMRSAGRGTHVCPTCQVVG